jgi:hypothetical protein
LTATTPDGYVRDVANQDALLTGEPAEAVPAYLERWIARSLLEGYSPESIEESAIEGGLLDAASASQAVRAVASNPVFEVAQAESHKRDKLATLITALSQQARESRVADRVPVETRPAPERFFEQYFYTNRPVVLRGLTDDWAARELWSPAWFAQRFGDAVVEVTSNRERDPRFEENFGSHRQEMTMRAFIDRVTSETGNDVYLVARNRMLFREEFRELLGHYTAPAGILHGPSALETPAIWIGPKGTVTPLHHDATNILFGQMYGRKLVRLVSPFEIENLYNYHACYSAVDLNAVDYEAFPLMRGVPVLETLLEPGDLLFLPLGWWHWVLSLDVSISLSLQHFATRADPIIWQPAAG